MYGSINKVESEWLELQQVYARNKRRITHCNLIINAIFIPQRLRVNDSLQRLSVLMTSTTHGTIKAIVKFCASIIKNIRIIQLTIRKALTWGTSIELQLLDRFAQGSLQCKMLDHILLDRNVHLGSDESPELSFWT